MSMKFWIAIVIFSFVFDKNQAAAKNDDDHEVFKRRAPVFLDPATSDTQTFLKLEDFKRAEKFPVPDQPYLPKRYLRTEDLIEGDIMGFTQESFKEFVKERNYIWKGIQAGNLGQSAIRDPTKHWPKGEVPYAISGSYAQDARTKLAEAIQEYHTRTCVRFVPRKPHHRDYIFIVPEGDYVCASLVGKEGGMQKVLLGSKCFQLGTIVHEFMHVVGFIHEQSRPDRDEFVEIRWSNIQLGQEHNFEKYPPTTIDVLDTPYDYGSVMHYGSDYFSYNGLPTIVAKKSGVILGQRRGFSKIDVQRVNILYNCEGKATPAPPSGTTPTPPTTPAPSTFPTTLFPLFPSTEAPAVPYYCRYYCRACSWCTWCHACELCLRCWRTGFEPKSEGRKNPRRT